MLKNTSDFKLPELDPGSELSVDYDEMIKLQEGLINIVQENKENLEYPEVELPEGTGKKHLKNLRKIPGYVE